MKTTRQLSNEQLVEMSKYTKINMKAVKATVQAKYYAYRQAELAHPEALAYAIEDLMETMGYIDQYKGSR